MGQIEEAGRAGESPPPPDHHIKLDWLTIVAIQKALDRIETGHGSITLEISQFRLAKIVCAESSLLEHKPKKKNE